MDENDDALPRLGETDAEIEIEDSALLLEASLAMATQCYRNLDIVSRHLDPLIYDNEEFASAVKQLALRNRRARIRLFIIDSRPLISRGHRVVELAQRLTSFIEIRCPARQHRDFNEAILLADNIGYIHRRFSDRFEATMNFSDKRAGKALGERIDDLWERGQPDPNFRRLML